MELPDSLTNVLLALPQPSYLQALAGWGAVWSILVMLPPGYAEQRCVIRMNMAHSVVAATLASVTILTGWDSTFSTSASVSFFIVDAAVMVLNGRRLRATGGNADSPGRWMDYLHHVIGAVYGTYLLYFQSNVCSSSCPIPNLYMYAQTNEISTPFYGYYRLTKSNVAGGLFALSFFLSRIVFNFIYLVPYSFKYCTLRGFMVIAVPYQLLQVMWMGLILKKVAGSISKGGGRSSSAIMVNKKGTQNGTKLQPKEVAPTPVKSDIKLA